MAGVDLRTKLKTTVAKYFIFCLVVAVAMVYANSVGWFPTYGIFSGENSMRSGYHSGSHGYYGIHGK